MGRKTFMKTFEYDSNMGKVFDGKFLPQFALTEPLNSKVRENTKKYYEYRKQAIKEGKIDPLPYPVSKELLQYIIYRAITEFYFDILSTEDYKSFPAEWSNKEQKFIKNYDFLEALSAYYENLNNSCIESGRSVIY